MPIQVVNPGSPIVWLAPRVATHVPWGATLSEVAVIMSRDRVSAVLVGGRASAIVTERDLARGLEAGLGPEDIIDDLATRHLVVIAATTRIVDAAAVMLTKEIRHVVLDLGDDNLAVVSQREITAALLQAVEPRIWLTSLHVAVTGAQPADTSRRLEERAFGPARNWPKDPGSNRALPAG